MTTLKIDLLDNALDYLLEAVEKLEAGEGAPNRNLKYAILHSANAVELLMKQRLVDEDWKLLFRKPEKSSEHLFKSGDFESIQFDEAIERVSTRCGIDLSGHKAVLRELRILRNKFQHFQRQVTKARAISLVVKAWSFAYEFAHENLDLDQSSSAVDVFEDIRKRMHKHETFVSERMDAIEPDIKEYERDGTIVLDCPACIQEETVPLDRDEKRCLFCLREFDPEEFLDEWLSLHAGWRWLDAKERTIDPVVVRCPECEREGLYEDEDRWLCLFCGMTYAPETIDRSCQRCGEAFVEEDGFAGTCPDCWSHVSNQE